MDTLWYSLIFVFLLDSFVCQDDATSRNIVDINLDKFFTAECVDKETMHSCSDLASCLAVNVLKYAKITNAQCLDNYESKPHESSESVDKFRCHLAPTAFVTLEKIREFLMETENGRSSSNSEFIKTLCTTTDERDSEQSMFTDDSMLRQAAAYHKFFAATGQYLRDDSSISDEIFKAEFSRNIRALAALVVSFGLPGVFSLCEPSHLKTTLFLQILSLCVVSFYQFIRKGLMWTLLSVAACLLVLIVQFGLLYLFRSRYRPEKPMILRE